MAEACICASCPELHHDLVSQVCRQQNIQKAFGKSGDMVNTLSGKDWIPKWEAKVVMATVTKAQTMGVQKALIICIAGGKHCDAEMSRQPALVRAIKTEMEDSNFRVRVEWLEIEDFLERYGNGAEETVPIKAKGKGKQKGSSKDSSDKTGCPGGKHGQQQQQQQGQNQQQQQQSSQSQGKKKNISGTPMENLTQDRTSSSVQKERERERATEREKGKGNDTSTAKQCKGKGKDTSTAKPCKGKGKDTSTAKPCKYFAAGSCKNGSTCPFSHSVDEAFAIGACVELHSLATAAELNGMRGKVVSTQGERVQVELPNGVGMKSLKSANLKPIQAKRSKDSAADSQKAKGGQNEAKNASKIMCRDCGKSFKTAEAVMAKHWFCKGREPLWLCVQCGKKFEQPQDCEKHQKAVGHKGMARVNDDKDPEWSCGQCKKSFISLEACEQHQRVTGHSDTPVCIACNKAFDNENSLTQHQQSTGHSGICWRRDDAGTSSDEDVGWDCGCGRTFSTIQARDQHQDATGHLVVCLACQRTFREEFPCGLAQHQEDTGHCGGMWTCDGFALNSPEFFGGDQGRSLADLHGIFT